MGGRLNVKQIVGVVYIDHPSLSNLYTDMNERLQRIANELEYDTYKDPAHGKIARNNFIYGVAQAKIEMIEKARMWLLNNGFVDMESSDCDIHFKSGYIHDFVKAMEE